MKKITSRFDALFNQLSATNEGAFVPFVTLCDPDLETSFEIICTLVDAGADALELGLPFSDPLLDGEVIQAANQRALSAGFSTPESFELLERIRIKYPDIPISLLLCANLVYANSIDNFYQRCSDIGIDAVLVADVPLMECDPYCRSAVAHGVQPVLICPPNVDEEALQQISSLTQGYTYLVSRAGVTSADNSSQADNLADLIKQLKANGAPPVLQGFGISSAKQVKASIDIGCAGAISGSAVVKIIENNLQDQALLLSKLKQFVHTMKSATHSSAAE